MNEFPELKFDIDEDVLRYVYEDHLIKELEDKATRLHNIVVGLNNGVDTFNIMTKILGSEKEGYKLHVIITRNAEHKYQENTHLQETDL